MELAEGCFGNAQNTDMQRKVQAQQQSARARKAMTAGTILRASYEMPGTRIGSDVR